MTSITIFGRRWRQRGTGNTYCTATIYVDGKCVSKVGPEYGYGDYYEQAAFQWLDDNGYTDRPAHTSSGGRESPWRWCERNGVAYAREVADVRRERDL